MKTVEITVREGLPEKSGNYLAMMFLPGEKKPYFMSLVFFNATTGRWNDIEGDGRCAMDIQAWADLPEMR